MTESESRFYLRQSGIEFIRALTMTYGSEKGMEFWSTMCEVIDPTLKGEIFWDLISGKDFRKMMIAKITRVECPNIVGLIRAIRELTGSGLKEAKDLVDSLYLNDQVITLIESHSRRSAAVILSPLGVKVI